jgi:hypothetical protein
VINVSHPPVCAPAHPIETRDTSDSLGSRFQCNEAREYANYGKAERGGMEKKVINVGWCAVVHGLIGCAAVAAVEQCI